MATLLYVDDEETIGRAVARWFTRRGHVVHLARSIPDAKTIMLERDFDVVFVDVWLGTESGFELMSWMEDSRPHLADRVTFVTGELADDNGQRGRIWQTLGRPVLQKPFDFAQLEAHAGFARGQDAMRRAGT